MFGDFFCAGHAWSPFGHLVIAGGTNYLDNGGTPIAGGNLLYLFDPETPNLLYGGAGNGSFGAWRRQPDMLVPRWYPTVTLTHRFASDPQGREVLIVSGGSSYTSTYVPSPLDDGHCTYEAFFSNPATPTLPPSLSRDIRSNHANAVLPAGHNLVPGVFIGLRDPNTLAFNWLFEYPRLHLLTNGRLVFTGVGGSGGVVDHDLFPGVWDVTVAAAPSMPPFFVGRYENSSVLLPYYPGVTDRVLRVGGHVNAVGGPQSLDAVEHCHALSTLNNDWVVTNTPIAYARHHANLLILPDLTLLSLNGEKSQGTGAPPIPQTIPELFKNGAWTDMAPEGSTRDYHATALVLPDGRVLSAGGEDREYDFQIYSPPYLAGGGFQMEFDLPTLVPSGTASALGYNQIFTIEVGDLPIGVVPEEAVLLAPGSITHHSDMHQRALKLAIVQRNGPQIEVKSPADTKTAPRGFYMLFALSNHGVPSKARWVWLQ